MQKLSHRCALNLWKGSGREPGEDKEGIWDPGVTSWLRPVGVGGFQVTKPTDGELSEIQWKVLSAHHQPTGRYKIQVIVVRQNI